ncbi:helix-turn-helix transcriptional regulator [Pseudoalteromonas luteoviolacea]|uniref:helix-turn-helix domain-containing protein n=1 Tax=Pseudoalteromonas luteoviolacea TaxID=43657 RepID=UPI001B39EE9C|nr:helix-turn-helix transcriptional regulator [Pseudoalteromonas luteoviolacea]MBQ4876611.1 helix-turn-helix transcriptional regulator [Pseudoalteromonas luteoviolacea]MBQ4905242.1 helix-turn-helix transcriptional regulator [Pseudoalteromonas luteoviolacea]
MNTANYCQQNILVIPQALGALSDVCKLAALNGSAIYSKDLEQNLLDIEFYTNQLCLVYVEAGAETLTCWDNQAIELSSGQSVLLCQGQNLHSDFVHSAQNLKAWLVFFDRSIIEQFIFSNQLMMPKGQKQINPSVHMEHSLISGYFEQLSMCVDEGIDITPILNLKLTELLHLLLHVLGDELVSILNIADHSLPARRNLKRLLENKAVLKFSVADIAKLSGRSVSGFQRDFKQLFNEPPKQWLIKQRVMYAKTLVEQGNLSITDIALEVGYTNISHFIKAYKSQFGETPKQDGIKF